MNLADHYSKGQNYTAAIVQNTYKSPSRAIIMTSFDEYNVSYHAYQQMHWMVNLNGVGIWSQSGGSGDQKFTNIYGPAVTQERNILLVMYDM